VESETCTLLQLDSKHVTALSKKLAISAKFDKLIKFITSVIPSFSKMSSIAKDRMGRCFKERHYLPGMTIIHENSPCSKLHLVMKGNVLLKSSRSPIEYEVTNGGEFLVNHENKVPSKKGYISDTVNSFQLGVVAEKQWIGEESLVNHIDFSQMGIKNAPKDMKIENFPYSAIAINHVSTLEIQTTDFKSKLPSDYIAKFKFVAIDKYQYLIDRMKACAKSSKEIYIHSTFSLNNNSAEKQMLYNRSLKKNESRDPNVINSVHMGRQR
jgi:hypothetical protein